MVPFGLLGDTLGALWRPEEGYWSSSVALGRSQGVLMSSWGPRIGFDGFRVVFWCNFGLILDRFWMTFGIIFGMYQ